MYEKIFKKIKKEGLTAEEKGIMGFIYLKILLTQILLEFPHLGTKSSGKNHLFY